jgi:two-component system chemotaxis response regulator CheY
MIRALIVDDSKFMRSIIKDALKCEDIEVVAEADNGHDGIEAFKKHKPDFVTMDITMGGKDGMKAVDEILVFDPSAKIIVISALSEHTIRLNAPEKYASAYLTKPFKKEQLIDTIRKILA